ncbi:MAG: right-handed parallel beta-helix repeat-containing protein, partial [Thermoplasmata archaeon]|nr:right-handed parallel beta-helix repeat-containing protein [Thermoplasmata archaeon]
PGQGYSQKTATASSGGFQTVFDLSCYEPKADVGDEVGKRTAEYEIRVVNYLQVRLGGGYTVSLSVHNPNPSNWTAYLNRSTVFFPVGSSPYSYRSVLLTVEASALSPPPEDSWVQVVVNGTASIQEALPQQVETITTMNNYQPGATCEKSFNLVIRGNSVDFVINVTNDGQREDTVDLSYQTRWNVTFWDITGTVKLTDTNNDPDNLQDTGPLPAVGDSNNYRRIIARVTAPADALKYHVEPIEIRFISGGEPSTIRSITIRAMAVWMGNSVSDIDAAGIGKYYPQGSFTGHNVNPGMMTSYVLDVVNVGFSGDVTLSWSTPPPSGWDAYLEYGGVVKGVSENLVIPSGDLPDLGSSVKVYLNVSAPESASEGDNGTIAISLTGGTVTDLVTVETRVTLAYKTIIIAYSGVSGESLDLDDLGSPYVEERGIPRLWNNVYEKLVKSGSLYGKCVCTQIVAADANFINLITSSYSEQTGFWHAGTPYLGWDETRDIPIYDVYDHTYLNRNTLFNTVKSFDNNLRTAVVNGKYYIGRTIADDDVDILVSPQSYPYYVKPPAPYMMGYPDAEGRPPASIAKYALGLGPSEEWIFETAISVVEREDPDVLFIMDSEPDLAGHTYGSEVDGPQEYQMEEYNAKVDIENMLDVINETDRQTGRLFSFLEGRVGQNGRTAFDETVIALTSDHGMRTYYDAKGPQGVDLKEYLAAHDITQGGDYEYIEGLGSSCAYFYNISSESTKDEMTRLMWDYSVLDKNSLAPTYPVWKILDKEGMEYGRSDEEPTVDQRFALYNHTIGQVNDEIVPDLFVLFYPRFLHRAYGEAGKATDIALEEDGATVQLPAFPRFYEPQAVGDHGTYLEQLVPLVLHGPGIKQGYENGDTQVEILDIVPTLCEINGWTGLAHGYFSDHEASGEPLSDCMSWVHVSPPSQTKEGADPGENVLFPVTLRNTGRDTMTVTISLNGSEGANPDVDISLPVDIPPGQEVSFNLNMTAPGKYRSTATTILTCYENGSPGSVARFTVITREPDVDEWMDGDWEITQSVTTNNGTEADPYVIQVNGSIHIRPMLTLYDAVLTVSPYCEIRLSSPSGLKPKIIVENAILQGFTGIITRKGSLVLEEGSRIQGATDQEPFSIIIHGELRAQGTPDAPVVISGGGNYVARLGEIIQNDITSTIQVYPKFIDSDIVGNVVAEFENTRIENALGYGVYARGCNPTFSNCVFTRNHGGAFFENSTRLTITTSVSFENTTFEDNSGVVFSGKDITNNDQLVSGTFTGCVFSNNYIGVKAVSRGVSLSISDCEFYDNTEYGVYNYMNATTDITNSYFHDNREGAYTGKGGSIHIHSSEFSYNIIGFHDKCPASSVTCEDTYFHNNQKGISVNYRYLSQSGWESSTSSTAYGNNTLWENRVGLMLSTENNTVLLDNNVIRDNHQYGILCMPNGYLSWKIEGSGEAANNPLRIVGEINVTSSGVLRMENLTLQQNWIEGENSSYAINLKDTGVMECINVTQNTTPVNVMDGAEMRIFWFLHIRIVGSSGGETSGIYVYVNDTSGPVQGSPFLTDSEGKVMWILCREYVKTASGNDVYTPHNIRMFNATNDFLWEGNVTVNQTMWVEIAPYWYTETTKGNAVWSYQGVPGNNSWHVDIVGESSLISPTLDTTSGNDVVLSTYISGKLLPSRKMKVPLFTWDSWPLKPYCQYSDGVGIIILRNGEEWEGDPVYTYEPWGFYLFGVEETSAIVWDFGDGTSDMGPWVEHFYTRSGYYLVEATVYTMDGGEFSRSVGIYVHDTPPFPLIDIYQKAWVEFSVRGRPGNTVTLDIVEDGTPILSVSQTRERGKPVTDRFYFPVRPGRDYAARFTFEGIGASPVKITCMGENSENGGWNKATFRVALNKRHENITVNITEGLSTLLKDDRRVFFDGKKSYDIDGEIVNYTWYLDDGTELYGSDVEHVFSEEGNHTAWLMV